MPWATRRRQTWARAAGRAVARVSGVHVHDGEWPLVLLLVGVVFLLLTAYYLLKVIREPLILVAGGAVRRSYARGAQASVLALAVPVYSVIANHVELGKLVQWKIAYGHRPAYSSGEHGSQNDVRQAFSPLFERYGVALVLYGHDHDYERSKPQNGVTYVVTVEKAAASAATTIAARFMEGRRKPTTAA